MSHNGPLRQLVRTFPKDQSWRLPTNEYPTMSIPAKTNKAAKFAVVPRFSAFGEVTR
jgi:hypothetical protein